MDYKKAIAEIIDSYFLLSSNSCIDLIKLVEIEIIPKATIFIKSNSHNHYEYFLLSGICRSYILNSEGEDITISFFQDKTVLTPNVARTFNTLSTLNFEALTEIEIARFKAIDLVNLIMEKSELRNFANAVLQKELVLKSNKEIFNASLSARDRLIKFREQFKLLENLIPHSIIATYLGITNISLSRLRKDLAKK